MTPGRRHPLNQRFTTPDVVPSSRASRPCDHFRLASAPLNAATPIVGAASRCSRLTITVSTSFSQYCQLAAVACASAALFAIEAARCVRLAAP